MKLALIPPLSMPYWFGDDNYKLILPEHWNNQSHLEASMLNHRRGGFTILDNGVAEGKQVEWAMLERHARRYHVNEIVLPDVMGDAAGTKAAVEEVFEEAWHPVNHYGFMGVVQGKDSDEIIDLIRYYLGMRGRQLTSIGIPRCVLDTMNLDQARLLIAKWIRNESEDIDIHLLGTNPAHIYELRDYGRYFRAMNIRGVDTSAPFVYTRAGEYIGDGRMRKRQEKYFDMLREHFAEKLLAMNISAMKEWVHG